jgi:hypothetical protein
VKVKGANIRKRGQYNGKNCGKRVRKYWYTSPERENKMFKKGGGRGI